ncbi:hypothetical protein [Salibacterium halotolerans]|uniref:Uncharacterized protein n=1 Tax=Salibacterium halotolerans TaxID=1884432 RepID=A0A1I5YF39_9BACI|nr:hypothetical protein [Salibacterium halotolerans]SFQ42819.1 hypothetical protein SAMN05518683_1434 [Salibacterium halotolerans]
MKNFLVLSTIVCLMLAGCSIDSQSNEKTETSLGGDSGSIHGMVKVNGTIYETNGNINKGLYSLEKEMRKVESKIPMTPQ